ncbi:MAG: hypothetical protein EB145_00485 [Proteobacteria bacterium]|nr:hypothetical protein [Pseudomonadota bacterium]
MAVVDNHVGHLTRRRECHELVVVPIKPLGHDRDIHIFTLTRESGNLLFKQLVGRYGCGVASSRRRYRTTCRRRRGGKLTSHLIPVKSVVDPGTGRERQGKFRPPGVPLESDRYFLDLSPTRRGTHDCGQQCQAGGHGTQPHQGASRRPTGPDYIARRRIAPHGARPLYLGFASAPGQHHASTLRASRRHFRTDRNDIRNLLSKT